MTDVPGHTRGLVPVLAAAGVELFHVGVNPAAAAPDVPPLFRWRTGEDSVLVMYDADGYGDVRVLPGTDVAVSIDVTGDNLGPRDAAAVTARFADLAERFPGAEVVAATLDDVADALADVDVPELDAEIGDSWIHGTGTAPVMTAGFRALSRLRGPCRRARRTALRRPSCCSSRSTPGDWISRPTGPTRPTGAARSWPRCAATPPSSRWRRAGPIRTGTSTQRRTCWGATRPRRWRRPVPRSPVTQLGSSDSPR